MLLLEIIQKFCDSEKIANKKDNTLRGFDLDLRQFCLYMRNPFLHIEHIQPDEVLNYLNRMRELGWKSNGIMPKCVVLRHLWEYAEKLNLKVFNHELIPIPKRDYSIPRVAKLGDINKFLEFCPRDSKNPLYVRNRCMLTFLRSTGCRNGEMCALNMKQLMETLEERRVVIKTAKSRGVRPIRELFWDEEAHKDLLAWLAVRKKLSRKITFKEPDAVFVGVRSWQAGRRSTPYSVGLTFRQTCQKIGIPTINPHSLRHYRGHELNDMSANNSTISGVLGHASLTSSFIYTQMRSHELKAAAAKFRRKNGVDRDD